MRTQSAFRFYCGSRSRLTPGLPALPMPSSLIVSPGVYVYNSDNYDLTQPGLYRFFNPMTDTTNRIVFNGDVVSLLSAAAWLGAHGSTDERQAGESDSVFLARLTAQARTSKLRLQCGELHWWASQALLAPSGVEHRTVRFLTMGTTPENLNGYDEGHICAEVRIDGEWCLVDLTGNRLFRDMNGARISARAAPGAIAAGAWQDESLAKDAYAVDKFQLGRFDVAAWVEGFFLTPEDQRAWYARIFQAVGLDNPNGETWWLLPSGAEGRASWVESLSPTFKVKDAATWNAAFYPD